MKNLPFVFVFSKFYLLPDQSTDVSLEEMNIRITTTSMVDNYYWNVLSLLLRSRSLNIIPGMYYTYLSRVFYLFFLLFCFKFYR